MRTDQIALQLYTVRDPAAADIAGTIQAVADAGYTAVEVAGLPEIEPARLARLFRDAGLGVVASHESLQSLRADAGRVLDRLAVLDCPRAIVPSMSEVDRATPDAVRRTAAELARFARAAADRGLRFAYHNHAFEFEQRDGTTTWDLLLSELPSEVEIELDVYWAAFAGEDPVARIRALEGRVRLLHMKDLSDEPDRRDAPPGEGTLPWPAIVDAGRAAGVEWYIVEQDTPRDPIPDASRGLRFLTRLADPAPSAARVTGA